MFKPLQALINFAVIVKSLWPLFVAWLSLLSVFGMVLFAREGCGHFWETQYLAFSTALSLGAIDHAAFSGVWRVVELLLDVLGIMLWGIFTSVTMKAIEGAYQ